MSEKESEFDALVKLHTKMNESNFVFGGHDSLVRML